MESYIWRYFSMSIIPLKNKIIKILFKLFRIFFRNDDSNNNIQSPSPKQAKNDEYIIMRTKMKQYPTIMQNNLSNNNIQSPSPKQAKKDEYMETKIKQYPIIIQNNFSNYIKQKTKKRIIVLHGTMGGTASGSIH